MKNNIQNISKSLKTKEFKVFLLFFVLSFFFWVFTKLSGSYTTTVPIAVEFINIPNDKYVKEEAIQLKVEVETSGFRVLQQLLATPKMTIDLAKSLQKKGDNYTIETSTLNRKIKDKIGIFSKIKNISPEQLEIAVVSYEEKKLPVLLDTTIVFREGYDLLSSMRISPDSIKVFGPKTTLDTLTAIRTEKLKLEDVYEDFSQQLAVRKTPNNLKYDLDVVTVYGDVDEFVYKELSIPVEIINMPKNAEITIFPKEITVSFKSPISMYNKISSQDFEVIADFKNREASSIPITLKYAPEFLDAVSLKQLTVAFVLKS